MAIFIHKKFKLELNEQEKSELREYSAWKKSSAKSHIVFGPNQLEKKKLKKSSR